MSDTYHVLFNLNGGTKRTAAKAAEEAGRWAIDHLGVDSSLVGAHAAEELLHRCTEQPGKTGTIGVEYSEGPDGIKQYVGMTYFPIGPRSPEESIKIASEPLKHSLGLGEDDMQIIMTALDERARRR